MSRRIISAEALGEYERVDLGAIDSHRPMGPSRANGRGGAREPEPRHSAEFLEGQREGYDDGYRAGRDAGARQAIEQYAAREQALGASLAQRLETFDQALAGQFEALQLRLADEVIALALEIARQTVRATITLRPETIVAVTQEAIAMLVDERGRLSIHANPADVQLIEHALGDQLDSRGYRVIADPAVQAGGCRVMTSQAEVDATLATRWRRVLEAIGVDDRQPPLDEPIA